MSTIDLTIESDSDNDLNTLTQSTSSSASTPVSRRTTAASSNLASSPLTSSLPARRGVLFGGDGLASGSKKTSAAIPSLKEPKKRKKPRKRSKGKGKGKDTSDNEVDEVSSDSDGPAEPIIVNPRANKSTDGQTILPFGSAREAKIEHKSATIRLTKPYGKWSKKNSDSSSSSEDEEEAFGPDQVIGVPPRHASRAIVISSAVQVPWVPNRFGDLKGPKSTAPTYKDDIPLLLMSGEDFDASKGWETWKDVQVHKPSARIKGSEGLKANVWIITRNDKANVPFLRIAITSAKATLDNWKKVENNDPATYAKDTIYSNTNHSSFSRDLLNWIVDGLGLPTQPAYRLFLEPFGKYNFKPSNSTRLVQSIESRKRLDTDQATGLSSLAEAIASFNPAKGGTWTIEYLTPAVASLSERFLKLFYAACQGVTPGDYMGESTAEAEAAKSSFSLRRVKLVYPSETDIDLAIDKQQSTSNVHWIGSSSPSSPSDRRKSLLHRCTLKSGRVNHSNTIVIHHIPEDTSLKHEVYIYAGSHDFTESAWGEYYDNAGIPKVEIKRYDLGAVIKMEHKKPDFLQDRVSLKVGYERPLQRYSKRDEPFIELPEKVKKPRKKKQKVAADDSD